MADSEHLKDFKAVWGNSCQSMWAELLALSIAESHIISNYGNISSERLLTEMFYVPSLAGRLEDLRKDTYLARVQTYRLAVITNRLVVLSASFETYFLNFLDSFIQAKTKYFDPAKKVRTLEGDKLYGEVIKEKGLGGKILKFGELAPSKIKSIEAQMSYLEDVYMLRNVLAHRAGLVNASTAAIFKHVKFNDGDRISITTEKLLELAAPVVKIAEALDQKL